MNAIMNHNGLNLSANQK
jgi:hypothetical protein